MHTTPPPATIELLQRVPYHMASVNGQSIAYVDQGQGFPLILIHGFGGSIWNWEHQQQALSQSFRVITLDLLGSGLSAKPDIPYTPDTLLTFFCAFMDTLGLKQAVLIGNSMGAGLAIGMALTNPDRVAALILLDGFPADIQNSLGSDQYKGFLEQRPPLWLAQVGNWMAGRWLTRHLLEEIIHDPTLITPMVLERSFQNRRAPGVLNALFSMADQLPKWERDFSQRLSSISHPTLILWGEEDKVFPLPVGRTLHETISGSVFSLVPESGHMPQWENPTIVNRAILEFLSAGPVPQPQTDHS